jgi:predicted RNA binding protein YcfA (HicA-like mRNA interferase family)
MKVSDIIRLLEETSFVCWKMRDGFWLLRAAAIGNTSIQRGPDELRSPASRRKNLAPGTLNSILKQSGLKERD